MVSFKAQWSLWSPAECKCPHCSMRTALCSVLLTFQVRPSVGKAALPFHLPFTLGVQKQSYTRILDPRQITFNISMPQIVHYLCWSDIQIQLDIWHFYMLLCNPRERVWYAVAYRRKSISEEALLTHFPLREPFPLFYK
jgi:hypothetical protein